MTSTKDTVPHLAIFDQTEIERGTIASRLGRPLLRQLRLLLGDFPGKPGASEQLQLWPMFEDGDPVSPVAPFSSGF